MVQGERSSVTIKHQFMEGSSTHKYFNWQRILYFHTKPLQMLTCNKVNTTSSSHRDWHWHVFTIAAPYHVMWGREGRERSDRGSKCLGKNPVRQWQVPLCKNLSYREELGCRTTAADGYITSPCWGKKKSGDKITCGIKDADLSVIIMPFESRNCKSPVPSAACGIIL